MSDEEIRKSIIMALQLIDSIPKDAIKLIDKTLAIKHLPRFVGKILITSGMLNPMPPIDPLISAILPILIDLDFDTKYRPALEKIAATQHLPVFLGNVLKYISENSPKTLTTGPGQVRELLNSGFANNLPNTNPRLYPSSYSPQSLAITQAAMPPPSAPLTRCCSYGSERLLLP